MTSTIPNAIRAAVARFGAGGDKSPAIPDREFPVQDAAPFAVQPTLPSHRAAPSAPIAMIILTPSPLPSAPSQEVATAIDAAYRNAGVQRAAGTVVGKLQRLVEVGAYRSVIAAAIDGTTPDGLDVDEAAVERVLRRMADQLDEDLTAVREDREAHDAVAKKVAALHWPLRQAVAKKLGALAAEVNHARGRLDAMVLSGTIGHGDYDRYRDLRAAGLNDAQIATVAPELHSPDAVAADLRRQMAETQPILDRLKAFSNSPRFEAALVAGIDAEIDAAIIERDGVLPALEAAQ